MIIMSKFARIENNTVMEVIDFDPTGRFAPDFVFVPCGDEVGDNDTYNPKTKKFSRYVMPAVVHSEPEAKVVGEALDADPAKAHPDATT